MNKINLRKQDFSTFYKTIPDINGIVYEIAAADPLTTSHKNFLGQGKQVDGFICIFKTGFVDLFNTIVDINNFTITRSAAVKVSVLVF